MNPIEHKAMKALYTRELPRVTTCGHKFDPEIQPRTNCESCWFQWLNSDGQKILGYHEEYKRDKQAMIGKYGARFVKMYGRFMRTCLELRKKE